jgi:PKD repeat protein
MMMHNVELRALALSLSLAVLAVPMLSCEDKGIIPDAIETPPLAAFTYDVTPEEEGVTIRVDASSSTDAQDSVAVLRVRWDWEADGEWDTEFASAKTTTHFYASTDPRTVRLEVIDSAGLRGTASLLATFVAPLSCSVTAIPLEGAPPLPIDFASLAFGGTGAYGFKWRFGDGTASSEQNPAHTFIAAGTFEVIFTLTDAGLPGQACRDPARVVVAID